DLARRVHEIVDQRVDALHRLGPEAASLGQTRTLLELAFLAYHLRQPRNLFGHRGALLHEVVEHVGHLAERADPADRQPYARVAAFERRQRRENQIHFVGWRKLRRRLREHCAHGRFLWFIDGDELSTAADALKSLDSDTPRQSIATPRELPR